MQRQPEELGGIAWVIDRKDQVFTQMEETWSTLILPLSERAFANEPLIGILEEDYSYFDGRYGFNRATIEADELRHLQWLRSVSGKGLLGQDERLGMNAKLLLTEQRTFEDSRDSLGLQLADMLAATLRRALNDQLQYPRAGKTLVACSFITTIRAPGSYGSERERRCPCWVTPEKSAKFSTPRRESMVSE